jgi:hypothetical protein
MAGNAGEVSSELPHRRRWCSCSREPKSQSGGSQSVHSSREVGNDHGAKGRRKVNA